MGRAIGGNAAHDAEQFFEWAFHSSPRGALLVGIGDDDLGRVLAANRRASEITAEAPEVLVGRPLLDLTGEADRDAELDQLARVARGEQDTWQLERRKVCPDGRSAWLRLDAVLVRDGAGRPRCLMAWLHDATEERRSALTAELSAAAASIVAQAATIEGALSALLPAVAAHLHLDFSALWEQGEDGRLTCDSLWQSPRVAGRALATMTREVGLADDGLVRAAARTGAMQFADALDRDASPRAAAAINDGLRSAVALPIATGPDQPPSILEVASRDAAGIDDVQRDVLRRMADRLAPLLTRKRAEQRPAAGAELLLVEDNPFIARLVAEMIQTGGSPLRLRHVETLADALDRLIASPPACVLLDLTLPDAEGLHALIEARRCAPEVPIVVLTSHEDDSLAVRAVREGAQDYLMKRKVDLHSLSRAVRYAMERKGAEQEQLEQRLRDPLTQLPNRVLFLDRLRVALMRSAGAQVGVLVVNLDRFRRVNDSLGPASGDQLLIEAAARLERVLRGGTTLAAFGADEFAVLLDTADEHSAVALAERLRGALHEPFEIDGQKIPLTATVGIALDRGGSADAERLLREADTAVSRGKEMGGGRDEMFAEAVREQMRSRLSLESGLHEALERHQLVPYFQPIVSLQTGEPVYLEALVRWQHPTRGVLAPAEFMQVAETSGLIVGIGAQMLDDALGQLAEWHATMPHQRSLGLNVNLSTRQLAAPDLLRTVGAAIARHGVPASALCLEVTETSLIEDFDRSLETMHALKALGVRLALDDFGTGYSSLSYLQRLPVDAIKLDRSFVRALRTEGESTIVAAVAQIADALSLPAVAEGVEDAEDAARVRSLGYAFGQGYGFGRPMPAEEMARRLTLTRGADTLAR